MPKTKTKVNNFTMLMIILAVFVLIVVTILFSSGYLTPKESENINLKPSEQTFEKIKETKDTPKEIGNAVLDELDEIVDSIDETDEDLSGLE